MTRPEYSGFRDLRFSGWIRENLPDSYEGFRVSDLDFIIANVKSKCFMLLEVKTRGAEVKPWQRDLLGLLHVSISAGVRIAKPSWNYQGLHVVTFGNTFFDDGPVYLDGQEMDEDGLRWFLSMKVESAA